MRMILSTALVCLLAATPAWACPPEALGTTRVLAVDPVSMPRVGRKHFPATLPLGPKEVVLTFDDGPWPAGTARVLDALRRECVRATFFLVGRHAAAHPALVRRMMAEGHTVAHHTWSHQLLDRLPLAQAETEIEHGFRAVDVALHGKAGAEPRTPFFRFPGFAASPELLGWLERRGIVVFGADLWASDWLPMAPEDEVSLVLRRLEASGGGILLLHDPRAQTVAALPSLLRELKRGGYRIVHVVPADAPAR
jgi:peptidoglycan/xylan/chitin deacetylase (PgdA/CDA1 family)